MSPTRIAPFLALVGLGCVIQSTSAQPAAPVQASERNAEDQRRDQKSSRQDEDAIRAVLRGVEAAFSDTDLPHYLSFFHSPYVIMAPAGVIAPSSDDEALALLRPQIENLRARGYVRSEIYQATVKVLSTNTALATVEWIRFKANDEELERLGATYAFFKGDGGWKIVMVTVYPDTALVDPT